MADVHDKATRSKNMAAIKNRGTKPELLVRRALADLGVRYRLHTKLAWGRPDIVMKGRRKAIFVHGCFWHRHKGCRYATTPASNVTFWKNKFEQNVRRDKVVLADFAKNGWDTLIVWECQARDVARLGKLLRTFIF